MFFLIKINTYFQKVLHLLGDKVPRPPTGALPLKPTGEICPPDSLTLDPKPNISSATPG